MGHRAPAGCRKKTLNKSAGQKESVEPAPIGARLTRLRLRNAFSKIIQPVSDRVVLGPKGFSLPRHWR